MFMVEISEIVKQIPDDLHFNWLVPFDIARKMKDYSAGFSHLGLLYLVPLHLLELSTVLLIIEGKFNICLCSCLVNLYASWIDKVSGNLYASWSSVWNVSVVISILDGAGGIKPFGQAIYLSSGCEWKGFSLMLIFFFWEISLRLPCLYSGCYKSRNYFGGIIAQVCLFCFGNVLKWIVCMIYFYDCKNRAVEKKLKMQAKKRGESSG
ncbi:hypothetical protein ACFX13_011747 [Malus domestica]